MVQKGNAVQAARFLKAFLCGKVGPLAAAEVPWNQKENIGKGLAGFGFLLLLPVLFLCMLPSFLFGGFGSWESLSSQSAIMKNLQFYQSTVWTAVDHAHASILAQIQSEIDGLGEDESAKILDDFQYGSVDAMLILCQYSVWKGTEEISGEEVRSLIQKHEDHIFTYDVSTSVSDGRTTYIYRVRYAGEEYFADDIFHLSEKEKKKALDYASNLQIFLYGSMMGAVHAQVSEEVLSYSGFIKKYAEQFGIPQFFDVICAVMMAESGGRGKDVMQASECPYNAKYPKKPNGITDPQYSIEVGTRYLADCFKNAGCSSPSQMDKLSLALQGYNYGNGYIDWALEKHGGYSEINALQFSKLMQEKLGWSRYGNPKYVAAVMKYLVFTGSGAWGSPFIGKNWNAAVSSEFGHRVDPINGSQAFHEGLDIAYQTGTPIHAVSGGVVTSVKFSQTGYGHHIRIDCGNGIQVLYAHCSKIFVTKGQSVATGQMIAEVGATGRVTGPHLHLGVLINGKEVNPREYISQ